MEVGLGSDFVYRPLPDAWERGRKGITRVKAAHQVEEEVPGTGGWQWH